MLSVLGLDSNDRLAIELRRATNQNQAALSLLYNQRQMAELSRRASEANFERLNRQFMFFVTITYIILFAFFVSMAILSCCIILSANGKQHKG